MRIAFSGSHRCGKSTLIAKLEKELAGYRAIEEPYYLLEEDGYEFSDPPAVEDFVEQLTYSFGLLQDETGVNLLFDRCPVDFLAYLRAHPESDGVDIDAWLPRIRRALETIDLVVFVPVEEPDRIKVSRHEDGELRADVDTQLKTIWMDDELQLGVEVLVVEGNRAERVAKVVERISAGSVGRHV